MSPEECVPALKRALGALNETFSGKTKASDETLEAIARAEESDEYDRLPLEETVDEAIRMQVRAALKAEADLKSRDDELIARVSALNAAIEYLTESFGGKPTVDEIANQMDIPQEEVMEIMKLMGETIPEDEAEKGPSGDDFWINNPDMRGFRS